MILPLVKTILFLATLATSSVALQVKPQSIDALRQQLKQELNAKQKFDLQGQILAAIHAAPDVKSKRSLAFFLLRGVAQDLDENGRYSDATWAYRQGFLLYDEIKDYDGASRCLSNISLELSSSGEVKSAIEQSKLALSYTRQHKVEAVIDNVLASLGNEYNSIGDFDEALVYGRMLVSRARDPMKKARALTVVGGAEWNEGNIGDALSDFLSAYLAMPASADTVEKALALSNVAAAYQRLGNLDLAGKTYRQARNLLQAVRSKVVTTRKGDFLQALATIYCDISGLEIQRARFREAEKYGNWSLQLRQEINASPDDLIAASGNQIEAEANLGDLNKARKSNQYALTQDLKSTTGLYHGHLIANLADLEYREGKYEASLDHIAKALPWLEALATPPDIAEALRTLADDQMALKDPAGARKTLEQAIGLYEDASRHIGSSQMAGVFLDTHQRELYYSLSDAYRKAGMSLEALLVNDRGRGQELYRSLSLTPSKVEKLLDSNQANKRRESYRRLESAQDELRGAFASHAANSSALAEAVKKVHLAQNDLKQLESDLSQRFSEYSRLTGSAHLTVEGIKRIETRFPHSAIIEYAVSPAGVTAYGFAKGSEMVAKPVKASAQRLTAEIRDWLKLIKREADLKETPRLGEPNLPKEVAGQERQLAQRLYRQLLSPFGRLLKRYRNVIVAPDGLLCQMPFPALISPDGRRLVESYSLNSVVSLSSLDWEKAGRRGTGTAVIADLSESGIASLPAAASEAKGVAAILKTKSLDASLLSPAHLFDAIRHRDIVHFAGHAYSDERNGLHSSIRLHGDPDGLVQAASFLRSHLDARLVVLSACDSSIGSLATGEGELGLTWAIMAGGATSVVGTRWKLNDASAWRQMKSFYANLLLHKTTADAMASAAREELRRTSPNLPYYWAAYTVFGPAVSVK